MYLRARVRGVRGASCWLVLSPLAITCRVGALAYERAALQKRRRNQCASREISSRAPRARSAEAWRRSCARLVRCSAAVPRNGDRKAENSTQLLSQLIMKLSVGEKPICRHDHFSCDVAACVPSREARASCLNDVLEICQRVSPHFIEVLTLPHRRGESLIALGARGCSPAGAALCRRNQRAAACRLAASCSARRRGWAS